jgi:hypothetical protein
MTRKGASKSVDSAFAHGRLENARAYLAAAADLLELTDPGSNTNPILSHVVTAAIGYADALTAKYGGSINQKDHAGIVRLLRDALGNRLPLKQARRLEAILGIKDEVQYGVRSGRHSEATRLVSELKEFAAWAEDEFGRV